MRQIPRIVVAGTSSGVGKTTVTVALVRALRARGLSVATFKCGPDYLDPTYHLRASERPCHNLDGWMMGREAVLATFARASEGADCAVIEGVMGLFDGASPTSEEGSTAQIAKWLDAPVLVVVDASGMARTIAAIARGVAQFDPELRVVGVIANRVGSQGHLELLRTACKEPRVLGGFPVERELSFPERHLGLFGATTEVITDRTFDAWGERAATWLPIESVLDIARSAPSLADPEASVAPARAPRCRIGLARDDAFHFYYEHNLAELRARGAELVEFSPIADGQLPEVDGLYLGGGYPEAFADRLAQNRAMLDAVRAFASAGKPVYAECGGLMYLSSGIRTSDAVLHPMVGLIPGEATMRDRLVALGYVEVETQGESILGPPGLRFRGHQFRYSELGSFTSEVATVYTVRKRRGGDVTREGYARGNVLASYVHAHWASNGRVAEGFVASCAGARGAS
jgi:cobyrinic acid a,c-diamide synthase